MAYRFERVTFQFKRDVSDAKPFAEHDLELLGLLLGFVHRHLPAKNNVG